MANKPENTAPQPPAAPTPAPYPWKTILIGLFTFVCLGLGAAALVNRQFQKAPESVESQTESLTAAVEQFLIDQYVPKENIERGEASPQTDDQLRWRHNTINVTLPASITVPGMTRILRSAMVKQNVTISDEALPDGNGWLLRFWLKNREFLAVNMRGYFVEEVQPADYTAETNALVDRMIQALRGGLPEGSTVAVAQRETRTDATSKWIYATVQVNLVKGAVLQAVNDIVQPIATEAALGMNAEEPLSAASGTFAVTYRGLGLANLQVYGIEPPLPDVSLPKLAGLSENTMKEGEPMPGDPPVEVPLNSQYLDQTGEEVPQETMPDQVPGIMRLALIIDDGGYGGATTDRILSLDSKLTLAIIPGTPYGTQTAERAKELGFEVIIHMPMESHDEKTNTANMALPDYISSGMTSDEISQAVESAITDLPGAIGLNNHTGSMFTMATEPMKVVLETLKKHDFYFVDSITTGKSVAFKTALEMGVPTAKRDMFLDNEADLTYIRSRFDELLDLLKRKGDVVAICHFRPRTADVLEEVLPRFKDEGVQLVHASEMLQ